MRYLNDVVVLASDQKRLHHLLSDHLSFKNYPAIEIYVFLILSIALESPESSTGSKPAETV